MVESEVSHVVSSVCCKGDGPIKRTSDLFTAKPADDSLVMKCRRVKYGYIVTAHILVKDWPGINRKPTIERTYIVAKILVRSVVVEVPRKPYSWNVWIGCVDMVYMKCQIDKKWLLPWLALQSSNNMKAAWIRADNYPKGCKGASKKNQEQLCKSLCGKADMEENARRIREDDPKEASKKNLEKRGKVFCGKAENMERIASRNNREHFEKDTKKYGTTDMKTVVKRSAEENSEEDPNRQTTTNTNMKRTHLIWNLVCLAVCLCFCMSGTYAMDPLISGWVQTPNNLCTKNHSLERCPSTSTERLFRELICLNFSGQPTGTTELLYHCQYDQRHKQFHEFMAKSHKCPKGHFGKVQSKYNAVRIVCTICPDNSYEPEATSSPQNLKGCHYKRHEVHSSEDLVLYKNGTPSSPDIYYCDYMSGYYSELDELFCNFHKPCRCRKSEMCPACSGQPMDLLPDGTCRTKCDHKRKPENDFLCPGISSSSSSSDLVVLTIETALKTCKVMEDRGGAKTAVIIAFIISVLVVGAVVVVTGICYWLHYRRHGGATNSSNNRCCLFCKIRRLPLPWRRNRFY